MKTKHIIRLLNEFLEICKDDSLEAEEKVETITDLCKDWLKDLY